MFSLAALLKKIYISYHFEKNNHFLSIIGHPELEFSKRQNFLFNLRIYNFQAADVLVELGFSYVRPKEEKSESWKAPGE